MKSKHFSMPGSHGKAERAAGARNLTNAPTHGSHKRQHHDGHSFGHPTEHGLGENPLPNVGMGGPDYGSMSEHGLSEGNVRAVMSALPEDQCQNSVLTKHGLQHVDYGAITGDNYTDTHQQQYEGGKGKHDYYGD